MPWDENAQLYLSFARTMNTLALPARLSAKRSGAHHPLVTPVQSFLSP